MSKPDDLSKPLVALDHDSTLVCVIEMSGSSWLVAATVPGVDRRPLQKLPVDPACSRRAPGRAGSRFPPARQIAHTAAWAASMMMQTPLVACRPPPGTNVFPQRATLPRQIPHLHSTVPPRSQPRTAGDPHAAPRRVGLAIEEHPALTDPNAASASSSQPPLSKCCDDRLNPPWLP